MSTVNIQIKDLNLGMVIIDETSDETVVISEIWGDQGPGLGIMVKGRKVSDAKDWERRFIDPFDTVERIISGNPNETLSSSPMSDELPIHEDLSGQIEND
jgi:hypothetical protein